MFIAYLHDEKTFIQAIISKKISIFILSTDVTGHWRHSCFKHYNFYKYNFAENNMLSMLVLYREDTAWLLFLSFYCEQMQLSVTIVWLSNLILHIKTSWNRTVSTLMYLFVPFEEGRRHWQLFCYLFYCKQIQLSYNSLIE